MNISEYIDEYVDEYIYVDECIYLTTILPRDVLWRGVHCIPGHVGLS